MKQMLITGLEKDFLASNLRAQVDTLRLVLSSLEESGESEFEYAAESIRRVENDLKRIRNFLNN